jgi:hypothetical protein
MFNVVNQRPSVALRSERQRGKILYCHFLFEVLSNVLLQSPFMQSQYLSFDDATATAVI